MKFKLLIDEESGAHEPRLIREKNKKLERRD